MEVPDRPIWLEIIDSRFAFSCFTSWMIETAKSMDCVQSFESDTAASSFLPGRNPAVVTLRSGSEAARFAHREVLRLMPQSEVKRSAIVPQAHFTREARLHVRRTLHVPRRRNASLQKALAFASAFCLHQSVKTPTSYSLQQFIISQCIPSTRQNVYHQESYIGSISMSGKLSSPICISVSRLNTLRSSSSCSNARFLSCAKFDIF